MLLIGQAFGLNWVMIPIYPKDATPNRVFWTRCIILVRKFNGAPAR